MAQKVQRAAVESTLCPDCHEHPVAVVDGVMQDCRLCAERRLADLVAKRLAPTMAAPAAPASADAPALIDADEAARLCGISVEALYQRVNRGQVPGVVRTGRRVQFHRAKLLEAVERKAARR